MGRMDADGVEACDCRQRLRQERDGMENNVMERKKMLPIGIENFEEIRTEGFYYVDKTGMLKELLYNWGKVNLFTRPRRFGKSLNMSMLKSFFEIGGKREIFDGLEISKEKDLCDKYMGKFPVIFISLKGVNGEDYLSARTMMASVIGNEALRFQFLADSEKLTDREKELYKQLVRLDNKNDDMFLMSGSVLSESLHTLSQLLEKYYGQKVVMIIDEYDVPLDKAWQEGYYDQMVKLVRNIFIQALKTNDSLYFAVLTGCLRISKESIFTGLNNPKILSVTDVRFEEAFGFTDREVQELLSYYGLGERYELIREWYDGYQFGNAGVYCPWDVLNYCEALRADIDAPPQAYWTNTSGNHIVKSFIHKATRQTRNEIERLIGGEAILKNIREELTYSELERSIDNLWSVLFVTGYLTKRGKPEDGGYWLAIPNKEIRQIFVSQIKEWFQEEARKDAPKLDAFCKAFPERDVAAIEEQLNSYLMRTISIRDTCAPRERKENFYHGILLGLLSHREEWDVFSNAESGLGYSDILIEIVEKRTGIVIEVKYAEKGNLEAGCREAMKQIEEKQYVRTLLEDGMTEIIRYGIACYKKQCKVVME